MCSKRDVILDLLIERLDSFLFLNGFHQYQFDAWLNMKAKNDGYVIKF